MNSARNTDLSRSRPRKAAEIPSYRALLVTVACLQNVAASGIIYGWASVAGSLLVASFEDGGAALTLDQTTSIFSVAASVSFLSSLFLGFILDHFGPRACSTLSHIVIGVGCGVFSLADSYVGFASGMSLVAFGGPGIVCSVVHLANLFPNNRFLVMTTVTGCTTLSFGVFVLFDFLWSRYALGFRVLFRNYIFVVAISALASVFLWRDTPYELGDVKSKEAVHDEETSLMEYATTEGLVTLIDHEHLIEQPLDSGLRINENHQLDRHESFFMSKKALENGNSMALKYISLKDRPFSSQVLSGCFWRISLLFLVFTFFASLYVASITIEFEDTQLFSEDEQHQLTRILTISMALGFIVSPPVGWLMDTVGWERCTILTVVVEQIHMLLLIFFPSQKIAVTVGFLVYAIFRQLFFPAFFGSLTDRLGYKYFGVLSGLGCAISGVGQLLIGPVVKLVQGTCHLQVGECTNGNWAILHIFQFVLFCFLIQVPRLDYQVKKRRERNIKNALNMGTPKRMSKYGGLWDGSTRIQKS